MKLCITKGENVPGCLQTSRFAINKYCPLAAFMCPSLLDWQVVSFPTYSIGMIDHEEPNHASLTPLLHCQLYYHEPYMLVQIECQKRTDCTRARTNEALAGVAETPDPITFPSNTLTQIIVVSANMR